MTMLRALLVMALAAAICGGCAAEPEDPLAVRTPDASANRPEFWLKDFTLGNDLMSNERVAMPEGSMGLRPRDTIYFAMDVGDAPPNANVEVVWHDPQGQVIHRESKTLQPGQEYVHFEGPDTTDWTTERTYRIDVVANGQVANRTEFELEQPETPIAPIIETETSTDTAGTVGVDDEATSTGEAGEAQPES